MSIAALAAQIFAQVTGSQKDSGDIISALVGLMGGQGDDLDLMDIVSKFQSGGLEAAVSSWLGDGGNDGLDVTQILSVLGQSNVSSFASQLGMKDDDAVSGLGQMIPKLIDQSSNGGSLLDSVGGIGGALNLAKGLF